MITEMEERNQLSPEDIDDGDIDEEDEQDEEVQIKNEIGAFIFILHVKIKSRTKKALSALCEIKNELRPADFKEEWKYSDDNIQTIAVFYRKLSAILDYLEKETDSISGKRNW